MKCANLGIDESPELLGGVWSTIKRGASAVASKTISVVKDSNVPIFSQGASLVRSAGEIAEEQGLIPSVLRTGGSGPALAAPPTAPAKDNTMLYVVLAAAAALLLAMRRK